ncbi:epimerase [Amycolatopsis antarctica]|uniref:Epimerase n=1 Tax=Amycolatopsis antarctica TaxID=1854586 RepID=A0A263CVG2_9PSEU|nr:NAD-dependent epimerase/dehydratase family protein [Amycolatopsis antarctica]OZM70104.1 epimerase [Amycolatopsis antarctica]
MRILVLGGTSFVGRAIVEDALASGAEVTLFGRGRTGIGLFPAVPRLLGDRDTGDYTALAHGEWDAVVDVSGYVPRHLRQAIDVLGERAGRYLFISTNAVYAASAGPGADEDAPRRPAERDTEELREETYGPLKVACEDEVRARYGDRCVIVRPGTVAGPHDPRDTFTYWVRRAARGGRVAIPGDPDQPVQVLDSRDLARLVTRLLADGHRGAFNAVGPAEPVTLAGLVTICAEVAGSEVELVPVPPGPEPFPLVRTDRDSQCRDAGRARAAGLPATPLAVTAAGVLAWDRARGEPPLLSGPTPAEELRLLVPH